MRNYIVPVLFFVLIFIAVFLVFRQKEPSASSGSTPSPSAKPSLTATPSPTLFYPRVIKSTQKPVPTPIIIHEKETEKETVREVPQPTATQNPQPTSTPPNPTPVPTSTPLICALGVCL